MPLYEYECNRCEETVEILVSRPDENPECPDCGATKLVKILSVPASPSVKGSRLPVADESCGAPRCCGGGCEF